MKVLIQHRSNLFYWNGDGEWVRDPSQAYDFRNTTAAIEHALARRIDNVQIVLKFPNPGYDVTLPFGEDFPKRPET